jgi:methylenetetrahydrofolate dehydrogenase (NADP+)/methenyltetrahydrofolate cyclohydrolase
MKKLLSKHAIDERRVTLRDQTTEFTNRAGRAPHLSVVLVGEDPASQIYVANKGRAAEMVGFTHETILFPKDVPAETVHRKIQELNANPGVDGILVQRPLPKIFKEEEVVFWVDPMKDVDCLHPENLGLVVAGQTRFAPCTPGGIMTLLAHYGYNVAGKIACVVGRSSIVGKPLAALLLNHNATILQVHRSTPNPQELCRQADFVFVAAGSPRLLKRDWIKPGAVVIDVGIHRGEDGKVFGDVDVESLGDLPSALSPVPGGVGPMTIHTLLENTLRSAQLSFRAGESG